LRGWGEGEGAEWVVREGVGAGGKNNPSLVCTYNKKKRSEKRKQFILHGIKDAM
jgi:hypothetical protein